MYKLTFIIYCLLWFLFPITAQDCFPAGVTLTTQDEVDNFKANNPGCTRIQGSLTITGGDITNLHGLNEITSIGFALNISFTTNLVDLSGLESLHSSSVLNINNNTALESLVGLNGLDTLFFTLSLQNNAKLNDLSGLNSLKFVSNILGIHRNPLLHSLHGLDALTYAGGITIEENPLLENLSGLGSLVASGYSIRIEKNNALQNFTGLGTIEKIEGGLRVFMNPSLNSLSGLDSLKEVKGSLEIISNPSLLLLEGLESLAFVQDDLIISGNTELINLEALQNLMIVEDAIEIIYNNSLINLNGLDQIMLNSFLYFSIFGNDLLSDCTIDPFCQNPNNPLFSFHDNAPGCNSNEEVKNACLVAVHPPDKKDIISILPNPAIDEIIISGINLPDFSILLYDSQGTSTSSYRVNGNIIDVKNLIPGVYFLTLVDKNQKIIRRIIKS